MRDLYNRLSISFFLNDEAVKTTVSPEMTALELLRNLLGLRGTKEVCSEGDCGACTVALGGLEKGKLSYRALNSCLLPAARLHSRHVITIEGLSRGDRLHPIQRAMLDHHATQCGYCTPGIIMSLFCLFSSGKSIREGEILQALEGNLCRCTGYQPILSAASEIADLITPKSKETYQLILPAYVTEIESKMASFRESIEVLENADADGQDTLDYFLPRTLEEFFAIMDHTGDAENRRIISGGTDLMVDVNVKRLFPRYIVDISEIGELDYIREGEDGICIGAGTTYSQLAENPVIQEKIPILREVILTIGSEQIRNAGTLAGNVANASPIADGTVALLGLDAELTLLSAKGRRTVKLERFFKDYRKTDLRPGEILEEIRIPVRDGFCSFLKSSKRVAVDIASVNSFCYLEARDGVIAGCRLAFGGMDKIPRLAARCPQALLSRKLDAAAILNCADEAAGEFTPISDIRGGAKFRRQLVRNQVIKHLHKFLDFTGRA